MFRVVCPEAGWSSEPLSEADATELMDWTEGSIHPFSGRCVETHRMEQVNDA